MSTVTPQPAVATLAAVAGVASNADPPVVPVTPFDSMRDDLDFILGDAFGEPIRYRQDGGPWSDPFNAIVESGQDVNEIGIPVIGRLGPIFVTVSTTNVTDVKERRDVIEWDGTEWTVNKIAEKDPTGWRLYCVR